MNIKEYHSISNWFLVALFLIVTSSCHQKVDWNPPGFEQQPVVNSIIRCGKPIAIKVSQAIPFSAETTPEVDNAEVVLYVDNEFAEILEYTDEGLYESQLEAQEEKEYRCEVSIPGYPTAECSAYIPKHQNILKFEHINIAGVDEEGLTYPAIKITFDNEPDKSLFYEVVITLFEDDNVYQPWLNSIIDPVLLNEGLPITVFSNEMIKDSSYTMIINYATGSASNANNAGWVTNLFPLQIELHTVCYDYYKFIQQQYQYELATGEPILSVGVTSTFNLHSNVENGYGIFTGYSAVKTDTIYP